MTSRRSVVLSGAVRTAIGTFGSSLKELPAPDLGAIAIGTAVERAGLRPDEIGAVVMGNVVQAGTKMNPSRQAGQLYNSMLRGRRSQSRAGLWQPM
jgi:acetyl-CoA C-acetyltransferase